MVWNQHSFAHGGEGFIIFHSSLFASMVLDACLPRLCYEAFLHIIRPGIQRIATVLATQIVVGIASRLGSPLGRERFECRRWP